MRTRVGAAKTDRHRNERGVVLVLTAILLVALLSISALVLDLGAARAQRRTAQNGADATTLAVAGELGTPPYPNFDAAVAALDTYSAANVDEPLDWSTCTDAAALAYTPHLATHGTCISYDSETEPTLARVRLPDLETESIFGGVLGSSSIVVNATAEAEVEVLPRGFGGVWPFSLTAGSSGGLACIKYGSGGADLCAGHFSPGFFGKLQVELYRSGCTIDEKHIKLRNNLATGSDHSLSIYAGTVVHDEDCLPDPNTVLQESGQTNQGLDPGLLSTDTSLFRDGGTGRLHRGEYRTYTLPETGTVLSESGVYGESGVDDVPLWEFIDPSLSAATSDIPPSCERHEFTDRLGTATEEQDVNGQLDVCFVEYIAGGHTAPVFAKDIYAVDDPELIDIQHTPRFGYIPLTQEVGKDFHILGFRAVYLHALGCQSNSCNTVWTAGPWNSSTPSNKDVDQVATWVFEPSMLPGDLATNPRGGGSLEGGVNLWLVN